jgi:putative spermidine/putrescine transport system ATP-binding protein
VRPEQIVLGGADTDCALDGMLAETIYLGDHLRLRITVRDMGEMIVKSHAAHAPVVGASVRFGWRAEDCRVFRLEQD